jgi:predicted nucleotidyltransferase
MKKFLSFLILLVYCVTVQAQKIPTTAVPKSVIEAFKKSHPTAIAKTWTKHDAHYEVKFEVNNKIKNLMYNTKGVLVFNEAKVTLTTLPAAAKKYMDTNFTNQTILKVVRMTTMTNSISYAVEINDRNITFDAKGNFIKSEMK